MTLTIYGPYYPREERNRLDRVRNYLKKNNFKKTNLVRDYPSRYFPDLHLIKDQDRRNLHRSRYCLETSDLNILIFTFNGDNQGVATELVYCIENNCDYLVFIETKEEKGRIILASSTLIIGSLKEMGKKLFKFAEGDDKELFDAVYSRVVDFFQ